MRAVPLARIPTRCLGEPYNNASGVGLLKVDNDLARHRLSFVEKETPPEQFAHRGNIADTPPHGFRESATLVGFGQTTESALEQLPRDPDPR